ncbi:hypothetical protein T492DRAFT_451759 [Pavlovales sp. CCMP2436]|nr:hypothetical protein T492DRAFT_451759 [Pavlovales sp. CCMP2436]
MPVRSLRNELPVESPLARPSVGERRDFWWGRASDAESLPGLGPVSDGSEGEGDAGATAGHRAAAIVRTPTFVLQDPADDDDEALPFDLLPTTSPRELGSDYHAVVDAFTARQPFVAVFAARMRVAHDDVYDTNTPPPLEGESCPIKTRTRS